MKRTTKVGCGFCASLAMAILAGAYHPEKEDFYVVEFQKPTMAKFGGIVNVTFYVDIDPKVAETVLRGEMMTAAATMKPTDDFLGIAWSGKDKAVGDEVEIDTVPKLAYSVKKQAIFTESDYEKMQK